MLQSAALLGTGSVFTGCSSKPSGHTASKPKKKKVVPLATRAGKDGPWQIDPQGSRFEPPIPIAQVPEGAWYCDMGTVHYAQSERGDETCKLCKMKLKHKAASPPAQAAS